jgi:Leucine-rich repeat (LRR) protein
LKDFTGISSDTFIDCSKLETLWIDSNSLVDLPVGLFRNQQNLQKLRLQEGRLKLRVNPFGDLTNLTELWLESMDLTQMEENFLQGLNIRTMRYHGNYKREHNFPFESLKSHKTIEELHIENTNMSQIPGSFAPILRSMKRLKIIYLRENLITSVEAFIDLPNVEAIQLWANKIEEIPADAFKGCPRLSLLQLSQNPIKILRGHEFDQLTGLQELFLWQTELTSIAESTFHPLRSLEWLVLSDSFAGKTNVIGKELFMNSTNLSKLDIDRNHIDAIHPDAFNNLHNLTALSLMENKCFDGMFRARKDEVLNMTLVEEKLQTCFENFSRQSGF